MSTLMYGAGRLLLFIWLVTFAGGGLLGADSLVFTPDYKFHDGIFLNFDMVKANSAIAKYRIITSEPYSSRSFFEDVTSAKEISFYDEFGVKQSIPVKKIWGYAHNGLLYIRVDESFNRINLVGKVCHFVATITTYNTNSYDPMYSAGYGYRYGYQPSTYQSQELRQYLLDFDSGKLIDYDVEGVELILMKDPVLHDEFVVLSNKKKKQMKFYYLRKYNERNPVYLPK